MIATRIEQLIPDATGVIAVIIMACAFLLSFSNLQAGAEEAQISGWLSWAWPVCVDALLIAGSLMILRSSLRQESTWFGWLVVVAFTGVSVAFNIAHSPEDLTSRATHAIPPITLMVSIEMFTMIIRSDLKSRTGPAILPEIVSSELPETQPCLTDVSPTPDRISSQPVSDEEIINHYIQNPGVSINRAATALGISKSTMYRRTVKLREDGRIPSSGIGVYNFAHETGWNNVSVCLDGETE